MLVRNVYLVDQLYTSLAASRANGSTDGAATLCRVVGGIKVLGQFEDEVVDTTTLNGGPSIALTTMVR
jgi:hypothetical protein